MSSIKLSKRRGLRGEIEVLGDKSISHRALILGSIAKGVTTLEGFSGGEDNLRTLRAMRSMGIEIDYDERRVRINGMGLYGLKEPENIINSGNSGTTIRLLAGLLSGQRFLSILTGDGSLRKRPMKRIVEPLSMMGADIFGRCNGEYPPLVIHGGKLHSITYKLPKPSAQLKSSIILAALYADGITEIEEPIKSRDHTERLLRYLGADIRVDNNRILIDEEREMYGRKIVIPGDISSAIFFIIAALITEDSEILVKNVGINETRTGVLDVLLSMGGNIKIYPKDGGFCEPVADIYAKSSYLKGTTIKGKIIPRLIDEIPILSIAASIADGETIIKDAKELRVKETDRIRALVRELKKFGVDIEEYEDGMRIIGKGHINGARCNSYGDHRMALSFMIAGIAANGETIISNIECIKVSFPDFWNRFKEVLREV